jgi:hypothetical protein
MVAVNDQRKERIKCTETGKKKKKNIHSYRSFSSFEILYGFIQHFGETRLLLIRRNHSSQISESFSQELYPANASNTHLEAADSVMYGRVISSEVLGSKKHMRCLFLLEINPEKFSFQSRSLSSNLQRPTNKGEGGKYSLACKFIIVSVNYYLEEYH